MAKLKFKSCHRPAFVTAVLLATAVAFPSQAQSLAPAPISANSSEISLRFDREPKSSGVTFIPDGLKWGVVEVEGKKEGAWVAGPGSYPEHNEAQARSVKFVVTDPRFKNGLQRAVDVEIEFLFRPDSQIHISVDTGDGEKIVHQAHGRSDKWQTAKFSLDNARFSTDAAQNPDKKFDIRIAGWGQSDFGIRSIKIKGFDFPGAINYARLLKLESINRPDDILLFQRNNPGALSYNLRNLSGRPMDLNYSITFSDRAGARRAQVQRDLTVSASSLASAVLPIDTKTLPFGVYTAKFVLKTRGANAQTLIERDSYIGMASATKLGKAKEGEFLYGLDASLGPASGNPRLMK